MSADGFKVEICVDAVESAEAAQRGGADRVELCQNLMEGGTTPSAGCIRLVRQRVRLDLQVMIRPRGGDFLYSPTELEVMREDIRVAKDLGANGVVFGCLNGKGDVDGAVTADLIQLARPMNVTFHRAFDLCRDPRRALGDLIALGVDRVLTSGQEASCWEGAELIAELQRLACGQIVILAGGGITPRNARRLVEATGVTEVHLSARRTVQSRMEFRRTQCFLGGALRPDEFSWKATDEEAVKAVVEAIKGR